MSQFRGWELKEVLDHWTGESKGGKDEVKLQSYSRKKLIWRKMKSP